MIDARKVIIDNDLIQKLVKITITYETKNLEKETLLIKKEVELYKKIFRLNVKLRIFNLETYLYDD